MPVTTSPDNAVRLFTMIKEAARSHDISDQLALDEANPEERDPLSKDRQVCPLYPG